MKKLISIILSVILLVPAFSIPSFAYDSITVPCSYDTYYENKDVKTKDFAKSAILLCGSVYGRYIQMDFDISVLSDGEYEGCVLSFAGRNNISGSKAMIYDDSNNLVTSLSLNETGKIKFEVDITDHIKQLLQQGKTKLTLYIDYDSNVLTIFSSEYSNDITLVPHIYTTDVVPYFPGQKNFEYPTVTQADFKDAMMPVLAKGHPYVFGDYDDFARIKEYAFGKDEGLTKLYAGIKELADEHIETQPSSIPANLDDTVYFNRATECYNVISRCALVYLVEGDPAYAERAWIEAKTWCELSTWGKNQYIDNNQVGLGIAVCYDWLYDYLDEEQRDVLTEALYSKHLNEINDLFHNRTAAKYSSNFYQWYFSYNNHTTIDNCFTFIQAMALADTDFDMNTYIMAECLNNLKRPFDEAYPDSAWIEGISYWANVGPQIANMFLTMKNAFGHIFGYENISHIMNLADFPLYCASSNGNFLFNDALRNYTNNKNAAKYTFGYLKDDNALQNYSLQNDNHISAFVLLAYEVNEDYSDTKLDLDKDKFFRNMDMVAMRNHWEGSQEIYTGMLVQNAKITHGHMNSGTFTLDALGKLWVSNPGRDDYDLDGYWDYNQFGRKWDYYMGRAEGNSCLVINPSEEGGQIVDPDDTIDTFVSKDRGAFAISDLTETYRFYAKSYQRGIMLGDDRKMVVVQDEAVLKEPYEAYSFVNIYQCKAEIAEDQKSVILSSDDRKVKVNIICDQEYDVSIMDSKPLPTSPQMEKNMRIMDIQRIAIHFPKTQNINLRLEFVPYLVDEELPEAAKEITPLSDWSIPDGEYKEILADGIYADGTLLEDFNPYNRCYVVESLPSNLTANADERYDISYKDNENGLAKYVILTDKETGEITSYMVRVDTSGPNIIDVSDQKELEVAKVTASTHDGNVPENTIDGDGTTRWSAQGVQHITWELGKSSKLNCIAIHFYNGAARRAYFDLQVSDDGNNWTEISDQISCGTWDGLEYFSLNDLNGRYVRLVGDGTNVGDWNSVCEIKIYGR